MHRTARRASGGAALLLAATLVLTACGPQEQGGGDDETGSTATESEDGGSGELSIVPSVQIDVDGAEVPAETSGDAADPAGDGSAECAEGTSIAMAGALTGPNAALGLNILYGAQVAVDAFNEANAGCQVEIKQFDTEGDPQKATQVAPQIVGDDSVIALLGPAFSGETAATGDVFNQAGLLSLSASATNPDLTANGWSTFYRGLANDAVQGPAVAKYMTDTLGYGSVCVVTDNSDYGIGLAEQITSGLGDAANADCGAEVKTGDKDFSAAVQIISGAEADAVFYAGYYAEAAPFVQQLRDGGVEIPFVSADGTNDPQFVSQAGGSSEGAILSCPCGPAPDEFAATYEEVNGQAPGVYSVEGYDLATIMLTGIASGVTDRAGMLDYVANYSGEGLARAYEWDDTGELSAALIWIYEVQ
ncbi:branched-chain amino acid ABC transporter substrate-binding protein [Cellulosimicrobium marinum]|uniref:branched-chain amino acid ABC transporter substrate-binding protein n=1 Tax=Cellulosimicrobium marinum TaxID=1638992 RepID=UPI001E344770|nr:branched-chain amino acid ABC transporter substrate-binding protein [Cellulosimicrobium marinum]MCB7135998.1 branched-chain amino acid ABC transporter substrate-binding protein [Cellulosimicrobium marinum]